MKKQIILYCLSYILFLPFLNAQTVVHQLSSNDFVKEFDIAGPFHQKGLAADQWTDLLEIDFLEEEGSTIENISAYNWNAIKTNANHLLDFNQILNDTAVAVAYASFNIEAKAATNALLLIYVQDGAKIYVNDQYISTYFGGTWGRLESFQVYLKKGINSVVIKVPNKDWGWMLSVKVLEEEVGKAYLDKEKEKIEYLSFLNSGLKATMDPDFNSVFKQGKFPELVFEMPGLARKYLGNYSMSVRWFDRECKEVKYPKEAGAYAYYAEIKGSNGRLLKKSKTLYCLPNDWMGWNERLRADLEYIPFNGIPKSIWSEHKKAIGDFIGFDFLKSILLGDDAAILLSFLDEVHNKDLAPDPFLTPLILDGNYHAKLKQKILNIDGKYPSLKAAKTLKFSTPTLHDPPERDRKKLKILTSELEAVGKEWMENGGSPFDMLIAQKGETVFHGSFGTDGYGSFTTETTSEIASITKLFTGILFAQYVEQGIIGIDDPVGKYLTEFPLTGPKALTLRHCFTHTSGFYGHGLFDGVHNTWLENSLADVIKNDTVGTRHNYNGMGYDLAGKVMEVVSGKSVFTLLKEYLYEPLGMKNTIHEWDLGYSVHSTAHDLAKVAQLLLNKGSYGNQQFFSKEVYDQIIPVDLNSFYPDIHQKWGIGITMMNWWLPDENRFLLSPNIIGHGSATSSVFWVIPDLDMVITQSRRRGNRDFAKYFKKMISIVESHF